ncbi:MAG: AMP-binding protein [Candidatus Cloacimonadales bacterium]|jgi:long-chain acyl-CoA synthetase|nr:AMP-binding protein [Candidatus Cloacimonadota bacterium]MDX9977873.1 AMP-binding protein [Candidatus Cloacimonadales bacterium]
MFTLKEFTLLEMFNNTLKRFPNRNALGMGDDKPITYKELNHKINEAIDFLDNQGISSGDKVVILSDNMPQWVITYFAITFMGAIVVPILKDFHSNEIMHIIRHSGSKLIFVSSQLFDKINVDYTGTDIPLVMIENMEIIPHYMGKDRFREYFNEKTAKLTKMKHKALKAIGLKKYKVKEEDIAAIIYTSGTTGQSKGVMLSHKNLVYNAYTTIQGIQRINEYDRLISILPLAHTYECTIGMIIPMMAGSYVYYLDRPPTPSVLIPACQKIKPTMILTVPLIIEKIFKIQLYPQFNRNKLLSFLYKIPNTRKILHKIAGKKLQALFGGKIHFFGIGGAKLSYEVERFLWEGGFPYSIGYGLTEASPLIAGQTPSKMKFRSTGIPVPGLEVKIDDPDPQTKEGEILVRGGSVMKGYYNDPQRTAEVFTKDGFFKTGDLGILNKDNYLYIKGRIKNVIISSSGENIYVEEVESVINQHELVLESMVFYANSKLQARVFLNYEIIDMQKGTGISTANTAQREIDKLLEKIRLQVNENLSSYTRLIKLIEHKAPFEKTPTMKIKRFLYDN